MSRVWPYIVGAVFLLVAGAWAMRGWDAAHATQARIDTLTVHKVQVDTLYRHDTLYFNRLLKVEVAKHDTILKHLTDTIIVRQFIALQDSTIRACQAVVETCEHRVAVRDSIITAYQSLKPSRISLGVGVYCGLGLASKADCVAGVGGSWAIIR